MSEDTLEMWAVVEDYGGPLLLANVTEYESWPGVKEMPGSQQIVLGTAARTLLWGTIAKDPDLDSTCWIDTAKGEILFLQCHADVNRDTGVATARKGPEIPVGEIRLDEAFVVAAAVVPASKVKTLPSKLMKQKVGGRPLSMLSMKRTDDDVGNVFRTRAGTWQITHVDDGSRCRALWFRWSHS